ncbi:MAG: NADH-quinone oxidoreductase subunit NuoK [Candidatus Methanomethylophilaceae archaeon]|nr:NADH-quinone oxidoreductase subunit NuoK [Candidatus Methanomethylophilaceae archaeon]
MIPISFFLVLSAVLFVIGAYGIMTKKNGLVVLMCIEMMLNAANINLVAFSAFLNDVSGQVFVLVAIAVAAAEVAVGIAILLNLYKTSNTTDVSEINILRW